MHAGDYKMKILNYKIVILILLLVSTTSFAKDEVLEFYNDITKKCEDSKNNFGDQLVKLDAKIKAESKNLSKKKLEELFRNGNLSSDVYSYLGTELINDDSDLRGYKSCGKHYVQFLNLYKEKQTVESEGEFGLWESCLVSDYKEVVPEIAKKIINCYNASVSKEPKGSAEKK